MRNWSGSNRPPCPYPTSRSAEVRAGQGIHLYVYFDEAGIPTANHTEHAALARCILGMMSSETGFDFASQIDACGSQYVGLASEDDQVENEGLKLLKPADKGSVDLRPPGKLARSHRGRHPSPLKDSRSHRT